MQLLPKTPTEKKRLQQRRAKKDFNDGTAMINANLFMSRTSHTNQLLSDIQATTLTDFDRYSPRTVSGQNIPEEDDENCLAHLRDRQPVATAICCTGQVSPDCTRRNLFPELGHR